MVKGDINNKQKDNYNESNLTIVCVALVIGLYGCTGLTSPIGMASARQQSKTVSVYIELTGIEPVAGTPLISWTEGAMTYDGTRGDVAKNKAGGDLKDDDTVTIPLPQAPGEVAKSVYRIVARPIRQNRDRTRHIWI